MKTGTKWEFEPLERELYCDYDEATKFGDWEKINLAIDPTKENIDLMNNLSNMIVKKYRDREEVCNGHGILSIQKNQCLCGTGWSGNDCSHLTI